MSSWGGRFMMTCENHTDTLFSNHGAWKETIQEHRHYDALQLHVTIIQLSACL